MNEFSSNDINEAKKRVEEMRRRSFDYVNNFDDNNNSKSNTDKNEKKTSNHKTENRNGNPISDLLSNLLGSSSSESHDSSDFLILALILILSKEGADNKLILALLYILL